MKQDVKAGTSGVYLIQCLENGRNYIGSSKCIRRRWGQHIRSLDKKIHHSMKLQEDWIKYGEKSFEFRVLIECTHAESKKYEAEYIRSFNSDKFGYNVKSTKETNKKKHELRGNLILEYAKNNGYEPDGNLYWFNIFDIASNLNIGVTELLKFFSINYHKRWNITIPINEDTYCGTNWDSEDGVQVVVLHKSFFDKENTEIIKCF